MPPYTITAQQMSRTRTKLGLSKRKLARLLGLSLTSITRYERGERLPSQETLNRLKRLLGGGPHEKFEELL